MSLAVSVVIPTYRRPEDLADCLDATLAQSVRPLEVIVVDNDVQRSAEEVVGRCQSRFRDHGVLLRYQASSLNSIPVARNLGVALSRGDIVLFLDDDFLMEPDYLGGILGVYERMPDALAVQGFAAREGDRPKFCRRVFFLPHVEPDACRVLPSVRSTYPYTLSGMVPCQWLSGCNASFRRTILAEFPHDENLLGYSFGEDLDQSYRIYKRYPNSLWITPSARGIHKVSGAGRSVGKEHVYTCEVYSLYLFYKLIPPSFSSRAIYWWSFLGRVLAKTRVRSLRDVGDLINLLGALGFCVRHWGEIRRGDLSSFNSRVLG